MAARDGSSHDLTAVLTRVRSGDVEAARLLFDLAYAEMRRIAHAEMRNERESHTLGTTALVHEAYLRMVDQRLLESIENRRHLLAVAACVMRRLLVDHARKRRAAKRGGALRREAIDAVLDDFESTNRLDVLELNDALERLAQLDERQARIVELRCFSGLAPGEIAEHLGVSRSTVDKDFALARAWLNLQLGG